jgi:outer membrane lipoprotein SlyB
MKPVYFLITAMLLSGCASNRIIIDRQQGTDMSMYQSDLAECKRYAEQVPKGTEVAKGAVGGAVIGGVIGAIVGDSKTASKVAGAGAVTGGVRGGGKAENEKDRVIKNCLRNRGYKILN